MQASKFSEAPLTFVLKQAEDGTAIGDDRRIGAPSRLDADASGTALGLASTISVRPARSPR